MLHLHPHHRSLEAPYDAKQGRLAAHNHWLFDELAMKEVLTVKMEKERQRVRARRTPSRRIWFSEAFPSRQGAGEGE